MGCWNGTCAVSNLHVTAGQDVIVFLLLKNSEHRSFCYGNALYDICPIPFYGKYNDYGAVEDCTGFGLDIVVEALRERLYEFGAGPNSAHDCEVNRKNFNIELLFDADQEDRLGIEQAEHWNNDAYDLSELQRQKDEKGGLTDAQLFELDRLANKIKKVDTFRQVTHVIVHGDIFKSIMNDWYYEDYVGEGKGTHGYGKNYNHIYSKNLFDSIPEYMRRMKEKHDESKRLAVGEGIGGLSATAINRMYRSLRSDVFEYNDPCMAGQWMQYFRRDSNNSWGLIDVNEKVSDYCEAEDWAGLEAFVREALTAAWINSFMSNTRKLWTQQTGMGSQNAEPIGYKVLANAVLNVLEAERKERGSWDEEFADEDTEETPAQTENPEMGA